MRYFAGFMRGGFSPRPCAVNALIQAMDPKTVVIMLAINLIFSGLLYHLIARRLAAGSGLNHLALGGVVFGFAYAGRLFIDVANGNAMAVVVDVAMVLGMALYLSGVRQLLGKQGVPGVVLAAVAVGYVGLQVMFVRLWDAEGRFVLLNLTLAVGHGLIALSIALALTAQPRPVRVPLVVLALVMGGLAALTALRGYYVATLGVITLQTTLATQIYYAYASLSVVIMAVILLWIVFEQLNGRLQELTTRDPLTGVLNRRGLDDALALHFADRDSVALTLLEVDIDHFKRVNDDYGHVMGDQVLHAVATVLAARVRGKDFVARVGGEEFLVGCTGDDPHVAEHLGERLRASVAQLNLTNVLSGSPVNAGKPARGSKRSSGRSPPTCTVSVGISNPFTELEDRDRATREADAALYAAKAAGRNCVMKFDRMQHAMSQPAGLHGTSPAPLSGPISLT